MNIIQVESTGLSAIGYDDDGLVLQVSFCDQSAYRYLNVPVAVFQRLQEAASKGTFFNRFVRGAFDCEKIEAGQ